MQGMPVSGVALLGSAVSETVAGFWEMSREGGSASLRMPLPAQPCSSLPIHGFAFYLTPPLRSERFLREVTSLKESTHEHRTGDKKRETPAEMTPVALAPGQEKCWGKKRTVTLWLFKIYGTVVLGSVKSFSDNWL